MRCLGAEHERRAFGLPWKADRSKTSPSTLQLMGHREEKGWQKAYNLATGGWWLVAAYGLVCLLLSPQARAKRLRSRGSTRNWPTSAPSSKVSCQPRTWQGPGPKALRRSFLIWLLFPSSASGDKALDGYSKKKYVCKLLFIFLLGHDIDFGHMEAVNLLSSNKYTEKQIVSVRDRVGAGTQGGG